MKPNHKELLEENIEIVTHLYFSGYSVKKALEIVKDLPGVEINDYKKSIK